MLFKDNFHIKYLGVSVTSFTVKSSVEVQFTMRIPLSLQLTVVMV